MKKNTTNLENFIVKLPTTIKQVLKNINKNLNGLVFLTDSKGKLLGSLSDGDVRRAILKNNKLNKVDRNSAFINKKVKFVTTEYNRKKILQLFFNYRPKIKCLPVINKKGIIIDVLTEGKLFPTPILEPYFDKKEYSNIIDCIKTGWISSAGQYVLKFEEKFKQLIKRGFSLTCSNGTSAITLALLSLGIKKNDEVIVTNFTFAATINAIISVGAKPVIVDIGLDDWLISLDNIKKKINKKTKAILIVHIYGIVFDVAKLRKYLNSINSKIYIVEDAAEALGSKINNNQIGYQGDCATFSFYANKNITTGEGGMVTFKEKKNYLLAQKIRNQGRAINDRFFYHDTFGLNLKMTNLQAAIGCAQLEKFKKLQIKRKKIFKLYDSLLVKNKNIILLPKKKNTENSYWLYTIRIKNIHEKKRNKLIEFLKDKGIETRPGFYPLNLMKPYKKFAKGDFKNSKSVSFSTISLPSSPFLNTKNISAIVSNLTTGIRLIEQ